MSLKGDKYETAEEVRFRLEGTIVLYDGKPVYITRVTAPGDGDNRGADGDEVADKISRVYFRELPAKTVDKYGDPVRDQTKEVRKYLSSKKFDLAPFKMGYFNFGKQAVFASRTPIRQNKQGLSSNTLALVDVANQRIQFRWTSIIEDQGFLDMVNGKYPSFLEVGDMLGGDDNDKASSVAISRAFALHLENDLDALILLNRGNKCGIALKGERGLRIPQKYHFLRHEMEECRIPLA